MKSKYIYILICIIAFSCKSNEEATSEQKKIDEIRQNREAFFSKSTEYKSYPPLTQFFDPSISGIEPLQEIKKGRAFIDQSELPGENNILEFKKNHSNSDAYSIYKQHIENNPENSHLNTYKQWGSWLLLTRLDLLSSTASQDLEIIHYLLKDLIDSKYKGLPLLSYGVEHLCASGYDAKKVKALCNDIINLAPIVTKIPPPPPGYNPATAPKFPPEIEKTLMEYAENRDKNNKTAIEKTKKVLEYCG